MPAATMSWCAAFEPGSYSYVSLIETGALHSHHPNMLPVCSTCGVLRSPKVEVIGLNLLLADWGDEDHNESILAERNAKWGREYVNNVKCALAPAFTSDFLASLCPAYALQKLLSVLNRCLLKGVLTLEATP